MNLTNEQWNMVEPLIPMPPGRLDGRGHPWRDPREVLNAILWILRTGAPWRELPHRYPPYQTCHRRFQRWVTEGVLESVLATLARHLRERGGLDLSECFIDATFVTARSGGDCVGKTRWGKETKLMAIAYCSGLPVAVHAASASPHEVTLVKETLDAEFVAAKPERLIGDRAHDCDPLDAFLHAKGIEMIASHRKGRKNEQPKTGASSVGTREMKGGAAVRLARQLSAPAGSLRAARGELRRVRPPGLHGHPTQVLVKWLLEHLR
jgi:transposase